MHIGKHLKRERLDREKTGEPVFCFKYLMEDSIKKIKKHSVRFSCSDFLARMKNLSSLKWKEIGVSQRHGYGYELLPIGIFKYGSWAGTITGEVKKIMVFRASGDNLAFGGIREDDIFHVLFIEADFGDAYDHAIR